MGDQRVRAPRDDLEARAFTRALLRDLEALETMLDGGGFDATPRAGVEQELFLVDGSGRAAGLAAEVIAAADDPRLTHELARYNLEANLPPIPIDGDFLGQMERDLRDVLRTVGAAAEPLGASVVLTGILPTLRRADLGLDNMTPGERFRQMNAGLREQAQGRFDVVIRGIDEFQTTADDVMLESANTSLQLHLQVAPADFALRYNLAQLVAAPLLAAATNSPLLLGHRLWQETRIALFERSVDARSDAAQGRGLPPRVGLGDRWVERSVLEVFRDIAARYRPLLFDEVVEDPVAQVACGEVPPLRALTLHNGTVWRWNRPCFGVTAGRPHLRIESRVLPAGPTVLDEVANAALFFGLLEGLAERYGDFTGRIEFDQVRSNLLAAARSGLDSHLVWLDGHRASARDLLMDELLPIASEGLAALGVPEEGRRRTLGVMEERVRTGRTGARWMLDSLSAMRGHAAPEVCFSAVTSTLLERGPDGPPVHTWPLARLDVVEEPGRAYQVVEDLMSTDLYTVRPEDPLELAARMMEWRKVHHLPVETEGGELVGLVDHVAVATGGGGAVAEAMDRDFRAVGPDTSLTEALRLLVDVDCLLVVHRDRLVGIVTHRDCVRALLQGVDG